jgi:Glycine rich protein/PKD-like domain
MILDFKKYIYILTLLTSVFVYSQGPQKFSYQAVIRNSSNALIVSSPIGLKISLLQGSSTGSSVYIETHVPNTNNNGLISIAIGTGTVVSGNISTINWANGPYFIKSEIDPTGGTNYTINGATELLSVPYALYSENRPSIPFTNGTTTGQMLYWNGTSWITINPNSQSMVLTYCNNTPIWTSNGHCPIVNPTVITLGHIVSSEAGYVQGQVTNDGNSPITARGFCWSTSNTTPTISNSTVINSGSGMGNFFGTISGLSPSTQVYYRAFATNQSGTSYGDVNNFTPGSSNLVAPDKPIREDAFLCANTNVTFTTNAVAGADSYVWFFSSDWTSTSESNITTSPQITLTTSANSYNEARVSVAASYLGQIGAISPLSDANLVGHGTVSYTTPGIYNFNLPTCVTKVHVVMYGGAGGVGATSFVLNPGDPAIVASGGDGGLISGDLTFTTPPGTLYINVGENGREPTFNGCENDFLGLGGESGPAIPSPGSNYQDGDISGGNSSCKISNNGSIVVGGGGGGATDIRIGSNVLTNSILLAGGGGGGGLCPSSSDISYYTLNGGNGGTFDLFDYTSDSKNGNDGTFNVDCPNSGGKGGSFLSVGANGSCGSIISRAPAVLGQGGRGNYKNGFALIDGSGGGGGGGYYAGAGGVNAGGGGGASFAPRYNTVQGTTYTFVRDWDGFTQFVYTGNGALQISW